MESTIPSGRLCVKTGVVLFVNDKDLIIIEKAPSQSEQIASFPNILENAGTTPVLFHISGSAAFLWSQAPL